MFLLPFHAYTYECSIVINTPNMLSHNTDLLINKNKERDLRNRIERHNIIMAILDVVYISKDKKKKSNITVK